ncbi:hypothetical protein LG288_11075 [Idiomarina seosinensis]|uniref:hypothetical protein n=1 Tax=Idiomarina seosinensis TaxID=281739 RepID=UPI00384CC3A2
MKFSKKLTTLATIVAAGFATNAAAETATDTIDVYAGLAPALELTCNSVKFGVWRVPVRSSGGVTTINLNDDGSSNATTTTATNTDKVALKTDTDSQPELGQCSFTGSSAPESATGMAISFATSSSAAGTASAGAVADGTMIAAPNNEYADIDGASTPAALVYDLSFPTTTAIASDGTGSFVIEGVLTIPETIAIANYGAYKQDGTITVTIDDTGN